MMGVLELRRQYAGMNTVTTLGPHQCLPGVINPTVLEVIACREALALAADLSLDHLVIANDCKPAVGGIKKGVGGPHITVVKEINYRKSHFSNCDFMFEGHASNQEAHNLVNLSASLPQGRHLWLISPHDPFVSL